MFPTHTTLCHEHLRVDCLTRFCLNVAGLTFPIRWRIISPTECGVHHETRATPCRPHCTGRDVLTLRRIQAGDVWSDGLQHADSRSGERIHSSGITCR